MLDTKTVSCAINLIVKPVCITDLLTSRLYFSSDYPGRTSFTESSENRYMGECLGEVDLKQEWEMNT